MNVWTYWEGPRPEYIQVCLDSMARVLGDDFHLVTPETLGGWLRHGELHDAYRTLPQPALRADAIRAALLAAHGGWWWDADTVAFRSPSELLAKIPQADAIYTTWSRPPTRVLNGYIYVAPGSQIGCDWLAHVNTTLDRDPASVDWCSLGEKVITDMMIANPNAYSVSREVFLPIDIDSHVASFFMADDFRGLVPKHSVCFGLNHSWFMFHRGRDMTLPRAEWSSSPLLIHRLLTWAANNEEHHARSLDLHVDAQQAAPAAADA